MTRELETWQSDSRVSNNSVIDHRSRRPVLSLNSVKKINNCNYNSSEFLRELRKIGIMILWL